MLTVAGVTAIAGLLLVSLITAPPEGAGPLRLTVPFEFFPPTTLVGVRVSEDKLRPELLPVCKL